MICVYVADYHGELASQQNSPNADPHDKSLRIRTTGARFKLVSR